MFKWLTRLFRRKPKPETVVQVPKSIADSFAYDKALLEMYPRIKIEKSENPVTGDPYLDIPKTWDSRDPQPPTPEHIPLRSYQRDVINRIMGGTPPPDPKPLPRRTDDDVGPSLLGTVAAVEVIELLVSDPAPTYDPPAPSDDFTGGGGNFAGGGADGSW